MRPLPIEPIAGAPLSVLGLAVIRGRPTAVVDPGALFDAAPRETRRFVTVRTSGGQCVALAFEAVIGVLRIAGESMQALPPLLGDAHAGAIGAIEAIAALERELVVVLRAARLVPEELLRELDALREDAR